MFRSQHTESKCEPSPPMDVPTVARMAGLASPQGVTFYLIKYVTDAG